MKVSTGRSLIVMALCVAAGSTLSGAMAQESAGGGASRSVRTGVPQRDTLIRLTRRISSDFNEKRLEDIMTYIKETSGADIEPMWADDRNSEGLDKDKVISVKVENVTVLALLEKVLERSHPESGGEATWQMSETGAFQCGPRARLNKYRRVQIYDINDLLMEQPDYREVPRIDLQQALQASQGGGGGGQSPFRTDNEQNQNERKKAKQDQAEDLASLIRDLVETDQWTENGGSGGSIKYYNGTLIVNGADYIHRGINGYRWWPSASTMAMKNTEGRRYVTLGVDTGISTVDGFGQQPVTAIVGGKPVSSGPPGGGGSKTPPASKPATGYKPKK